MSETSAIPAIPEMPDSELQEAIVAMRKETVRRRIEARRTAAEEVMQYAFTKGFTSTSEIRRALDAVVPDTEGREVYVNPKDPTLTWGGRGRKPLWLKDLEASGVDIDSLRQ